MQADAKTVAELKDRYNDLARRFDVQTDNAVFEKFVAPGFGLAAVLPAAPAPTRPQSAEDLVMTPPAPPPPPVEGMVLKKVDDNEPPVPPLALFGASLLLFAGFGGGISAYRRQA